MDGVVDVQGGRAWRPLTWAEKIDVQSCVRGVVLPCGCLGGLYARADGTVVLILDFRGAGCGVPGHRPDYVFLGDALSVS